ncbi:uncharacterized protein LOC125648099 [Ostrea edulis]|uniref:uncharacterized protein LOC125648099 n=1 Tax=Ostrea edulis TaxID=37623 RepID=UPI002095C1CB|nr:uncharacterized protein LOC125648099 [Ostrea edulis]
MNDMGENNFRSSSTSSYLEPVLQNSPADHVVQEPTESKTNISTPGDTHTNVVQGSQADPYASLNSYKYRHSYTGLRDNPQYDDVYSERTGSVRYDRLQDQVYHLPYQNPITDGNNIENPPEKKLLAFMWCCSITSLIINCPIGVFSVCYSYMAKTESFYPMRRYYRCMALVVSTVAIIGFIITIITVSSVLITISNSRR